MRKYFVNVSTKSKFAMVKICKIFKTVNEKGDTSQHIRHHFLCLKIFVDLQVGVGVGGEAPEKTRAWDA